MSDDAKSGGIESFGVSMGDRGSASEKSERGPLRIVVVSELVARPEFSTGANPPAKSRPIDKLSFDQVMQELAPAFAIEVPDPFVPSDAPLRIDLRWREFKSLRPDAIVDQVPILRALVDARKVVQSVKDRKMQPSDAGAQLTRMLARASWAEALVSEVSVARPSVSPSSPDVNKAAASHPVDSILDMVDIAAPPPPAEAPPKNEKKKEDGQFSSLVSAVAMGRNDRRADRADVGSAIERLERAFTRVVGEILQHPEVRRLERAWRGLKLLVEHAEFRAGVEVDVVCASPDNAEDALAILAGGNEGERAPIDLIVVDTDVQATRVDLDRAEKWAQIGEALHAPVIVNGTASLVGLDDLAELGKTSRRLTGSTDPRAVATRSVASRDASRWLAIALNGVLARAPYTASTSRLKELPFQEHAKDRAAHVFVGAAYVVAALCAESYVRTDWPTAITGPRNGALGDLPVHEVTDEGQSYAMPLEAFVTPDAQAEAARAGFIVLTCAANQDVAIVSSAPVFYRGPLGAAGDAPATTSLADQLFIGRFASALEQLASAIPSDIDPAGGAEVAREALSGLFANAAPPGPELSVKIKNARLEVTVRPRRFAGISLEEITLGAALA